MTRHRSGALPANLTHPEDGRGICYGCAMFSSFFPNPRLFFPAALLWTGLTMALWYGLARDLGPELSLGGLAGFAYPPAGADGAAVAVETARNIWLFQYMIVTGAVFVGLVGW